jgi:hypothetical protein
MMYGWMLASVVVGFINLTLTVVLLALYRKIYTKTRAGFTLALLAFAGAFLVQNILIIYSYLAMMTLIPAEFAPYLFLIGLCEAAGLSAIAYTAFT